MAIFSFFRTPRHQKFNYVPRYYNPIKEKIDEIVKGHEHDANNDTELIKSRISSTFRRRGTGGNTAYSQVARRRSNYLLLAIIAILLALTYAFLTVYLPRFIDLVEG